MCTTESDESSHDALTRASPHTRKISARLPIEAALIHYSATMSDATVLFNLRWQATSYDSRQNSNGASNDRHFRNLIC